MKRTNPYYVIAPIDGIHMDFDRRMYSAELYGCPPDYRPNPAACPEFRQPYSVVKDIPLREYSRLVPTLISDALTIDILADLPDRTLANFTCIGFQIDLDKATNLLENAEIFRQVVEWGESFLDPLRLWLFTPGKNESAGRFGSVGNGIQCFWIGENDGDLKFFARKSLHYALTQKPIDVLEETFGLVQADITFRGLSGAVFRHPLDRDMFHESILRAVRAFRESRDIPLPEARFRQLTVIAEDLAKIEIDKRIAGRELRERIAKISSRGWMLYEQFNNSTRGHLLKGKNAQISSQRYREIGWDDEQTAQKTIKDLWDNVRNPFSHSLETFETLERDANQDIANAEKIVVSMINGWYAAYEAEDTFDKPIHAILLDDE
jgi:hypothetical protein